MDTYVQNELEKKKKTKTLDVGSNYGIDLKGANGSLS